MKRRQQLVAPRLVAFSLLMGLAGTSTVWAQWPGQRGGPGGPPPGGPGGNFWPSIRMRLGDEFGGLADLEKSKTPLTKAQAKQVVALIRPWQKKPTMSEAEAQSLLTRLTAMLTAQQQNAWRKLGAAHRPPGFRPGGPGGPGGPPPGGPGPDGRGGPGGPGGPSPNGMGGPLPGVRSANGGRRGPGQRPGGPPDRARMQQMQAFFKTFNPFYAAPAAATLKTMPPPCGITGSNTIGP